MKTVILAGGLGTRLSEKTADCPKPMVEIGNHPVLWHIMQLYAHHGFSEFIVALGYKGEVIKNYFYNFYAMNCDLSINLASGETLFHRRPLYPWTIHLVETGLNTPTGGRIRRLKEWIGHERFMLTYGDGLADIDLEQLLDFHCAHGKLATVTSVRPPARFGALHLEGTHVTHFTEKAQIDVGWINGGFFVLEPEIFDYLENDTSAWEHEPLERLAQEGELVAFQHTGFWQPMDTLREWRYLNALWQSGKAPWQKSGKHDGVLV